MDTTPRIIWPTTPEGWHDHFIKLDKEYDTDPKGPLGHDSGRCPLHPLPTVGTR